jgi:uncharacterized protein (DUF486 family)
MRDTPLPSIPCARGVGEGAAGEKPDRIGDNACWPASPLLPDTTLSSLSSLSTHPALACAALLTFSNLFMTFAWYGHLKNLHASPWWTAALFSWGIALFEYLLQVPANRIGYTTLSLAQLKILQEVVTLSVFVPFAVVYMGEPVKLDYLWAALCLMGAVFFIFRA